MKNNVRIIKMSFIAGLILFSGLVQTVNAQDLISKRGEKMLPDSGDWAVAIDASPFLNYLGNVFSASGDNSIFKSFGDSSITVMGKYFKSRNKAVRIKLNVGFNSDKQKFNSVRDGQTIQNTNVTVEDSWKSKQTSISIGAGIENRKGKTRLQGIYGGEAKLFYLQGKKDSYVYGNSFSKTNASPNSHDFNGNILAASTRITNKKDGATFGLELRGFVGMEYFVFPKISLGMEYGLSMQLSKKGDGQVVKESWDTINSEKITETSNIAGANYFSFNSGLKNGNALIYAAFHF